MLKYLKTSPRRAFLTQQLLALGRGKRFVLAYPFVSGAFYFAQTRSSVNTLAVQFGAPLKSRLDSLGWMAAEGRFPEKILRLKQHAWNWGVEETPAIQFPREDPYSRFVECARGRTVLDLPEFEAIEVKPNGVERCASEALR